MNQEPFNTHYKCEGESVWCGWIERFMHCSLSRVVFLFTFTWATGPALIWSHLMMTVICWVVRSFFLSGSFSTRADHYLLDKSNVVAESGGNSSVVVLSGRPNHLVEWVEKGSRNIAYSPFFRVLLHTSSLSLLHHRHHHHRHQYQRIGRFNLPPTTTNSSSSKNTLFHSMNVEGKVPLNGSWNADKITNRPKSRTVCRQRVGNEESILKSIEKGELCLGCHWYWPEDEAEVAQPTKKAELRRRRSGSFYSPHHPPNLSLSVMMRPSLFIYLFNTQLLVDR